MPQIDHLALQREDPVRDVLVFSEELLLDLVDIVLDAVEHVAVPAGHVLERAPEHPVRPAIEHVGELFEERPELLQIDRPVGRDRDEEVLADEQVDLVALDGLRRVVVLPGLHHDEEVLAVPVELRALVGAEGRRDPEGLEPEHRRELVHLLTGGLGQVHPHHAANRPRLGERRRRVGVGLQGCVTVVDDAVRLGHPATLDAPTLMSAPRHGRP